MNGAYRTDLPALHDALEGLTLAAFIAQDGDRQCVSQALAEAAGAAAVAFEADSREQRALGVILRCDQPGRCRTRTGGGGVNCPERDPVTYVTEVWCPPADDGRHQLHSQMKQPAPGPEPQSAPEPEPGA